MTQKADVDYAKVLVSEVAADGGLGTNWRKINGYVREGTGSLMGSDASVTAHKNVNGDTIKSSSVLGDNNLNLQIGDISAENRSYFMGGTVETSAIGTNYKAPSGNQAIYRSFMLIGLDGIVDYAVNVKIDAYFAKADNDLAYIQSNGLVEKPTKAGVEPSGSWEGVDADANDITSFSMAEETAPATITPASHKVDITVAALTDPSALVATIGVSLGAFATPVGGEAIDYTNPVEFEVESINGATQTWTVTVTVTP